MSEDPSPVEVKEDGSHHSPTFTDEELNAAAEKITSFMRMAAAKKATEKLQEHVEGYIGDKCTAEQQGSTENVEEDAPPAEEPFEAFAEEPEAEGDDDDQGGEDVEMAPAAEPAAREEETGAEAGSDSGPAYDSITYNTEEEDEGNVGTEVAPAKTRLGMEVVSPDDLEDNVGTEAVEAKKDKPALDAMAEPSSRQVAREEEETHRPVPNPSHGCQAGTNSHEPEETAGGSGSGSGSGSGDNDDKPSRSPSPPKIQYVEVEKQAAQGEVELTATILPMGFKIRKTLRVARFASGSIPEDRLSGEQPSEGWVLVAKDVFDVLGGAMAVHPQSFNLYRGNQRVRFVDALFLERDLYAEDSATRSEPLWLDVAFPEDTDVPSHLAFIRPTEVLMRCVTVHQEPPPMPTAVLAEGRRRGMSYDEVIARIYAEAEERGEAKWTIVAIVHDGTGIHKPYLGGYAVKKDRSKVFYHASTQLFMKGFNYSPASHRPPVDDLLSRRTQTWGVTRSCQTRRECCVMTPCKELVVDYSRVFSVVARPYFHASALRTLKIEKTIILQKFYRQWKARKIRRQLEAEDAEKQHRAEARQMAEEAAKMETDSREQLRRDDPRTQEDFDRLKQELMAWINAENRKIVKNTALSAEKKRAALLALNNQELKMLQDLENRRRTIMLLQKDHRFAIMFEKMSAPKLWGDVAVRTPETERAAELRALYLTLIDPHLPTSGRLDVLLHIKWTVKEFNAPLTRELCQLIDREADLLNRGRREASLSGLRFRIEKLFKRFIEDPEYNPGMAEYTRTAVGRAKAKQLYGTVYDEHNRMTVDPALQEKLRGRSSGSAATSTGRSNGDNGSVSVAASH